MHSAGTPQGRVGRDGPVAVGHQLSRDYRADIEGGGQRGTPAESRAAYAAWDAEDRRLDRLIAYGPWWKRRRYQKERAENTMRFRERSDRWHEGVEDSSNALRRP
jgi:hypothetical protein